MSFSISTHTPLAGRDNVRPDQDRPEGISTHTPLAGRDNFKIGGNTYNVNFYSHAPCGT